MSAALMPLAGLSLPGFLHERTLYDLSWLLLGLPLAGWISLLSARRKRPTSLTALIFTGVLAAYCVLVVVSQAHLGSSHSSLYRFLNLVDSGLAPAQSFTLSIGVQLDQLSSEFLLAALGLIFVVMIYSLGFMRGDDGYVRHYRALTLFALAMAGALSAISLFQFLFFWQLASVAMFLLGGHGWSEPEASRGARRVFVATLFTDAGLLLSLAYFQYRWGDLSLANLGILVGNHKAGLIGLGLLSLLLIGSAAGRAALFPFQAWLGGAVEAPAPAMAVSLAGGNLLLGGYLMLRVFPVIHASGGAMTLLALTGAVGGILGLVLALGTGDLRRAVAYIASSQVGLVFLALGAGIPGRGAIVALAGIWITGLLLLTSGAVTAGFRTGDFDLLGGVRQRMPRTALAHLVGTIAVLVVDWLAVAALQQTAPAYAVLAFIFAVLAGLALMRAQLRTFSGGLQQRRAFEPRRVREVAGSQQLAYVVLVGGAVLTTILSLPGPRLPGLLTWFERQMVVGGIVPLPDSVQAVGLVIAGLLVAGGAAAAWLIFVRPAQSAALRQNLAAAGALTEDGYHFETGYSELHERGALPVGWLAGWIDLRVLQAVADAVGDAFDEAGALARRLEGDSLRDQLAVGGAALVIVLVVFAALHTGVAPISVGGK